MNCKTCQEPVNANTLKCSGPCSESFHISCLASINTQYKNALTPYMNKIPNLLWFCDNCIPDPSNLPKHTAADLTNHLDSIKSFVDTILTTLNSSQMPTHTDTDSTPLATQHLNENIDNQSNGSFSTAESNEPMDILSPLFNVTTRNKNKRLLNQSPESSHRTKHSRVDDNVQQTQMAIETVIQNVQHVKSLADFIIVKKSAPATAPKITTKTNMIRSIYVSPFNPTSDPSVIMKHLEANENLKHIVPNIVCKRLASKNRRTTFVSYKLDVPRHHFDIIVKPENWPMGLTIKEFIDNRTSHSSATNDYKNPFAKSTTASSTNQLPRQFNNPDYMDQPHLFNRGNFRNRHWNQGRNRPRAYYSRYHDRYEDDQYGRRPRYRR